MNIYEEYKSKLRTPEEAVKVVKDAPLPAELDSGMHKVSIIVQLAKFETLKKALNDAGIPHIKLGIDQQMRDFGQASTAIQAFADVL